MRVLVCGGRDYSDKTLYQVLDDIHYFNLIDVVIEGDAPGADRMAGYWAKKNRIDLLLFPAEWDKYGRRAGPIRNKRMLEEGKPDLVLAFPGGSGTANMVKLAEEAGVEVWKVSEALQD